MARGDTISSTHYNVGKCITKLLTPLAQNEYSLKDNFDAAESIKRMLKELIKNEENTLILLDVVSLLPNVPSGKTVNIFLDLVYNQKLIRTALSKKVLKNLILDNCHETTFTFNNIIYEQKDGVSIGGSLGPVLANIIMTECEKVIVGKLVKEGPIKFYVHYVDDTLLVAKRQQIDKVLKAFKGFDKNLKFTVDKFENETPHFKDLGICLNILTIF